MTRSSVILLGVLALASTAGDCDATDTGQVERTREVSQKRYVVERSDAAPASSGVVAIVTLRDRLSGDCYMVITAGNGVIMDRVPCERPPTTWDGAREAK